MPQPFNSFLRGFLGLHDAKVRGRAPQEFQDYVQPTIDTLPFQLVQQSHRFGFSTAALGTNAEGFNPDVNAVYLVPAGEVWYIQQACLDTLNILAAAEELQMCLAFAMREEFGGTMHMQCGQMCALSLAGTKPSAYMDRAIWLKPGDQLGAFVNRIVTAATITIFIKAEVIRIPI